MEIADIFVVNKSDRPDADSFVNNLRQMLAPAFNNKDWAIPIIKTIACQQNGIDALVNSIHQHQLQLTNSEKKYWLLAERAYQLIQQKRMKNINKQQIRVDIAKRNTGQAFNLYKFVNNY
jgi:LAO/AO transport system kinase